MFIYVLAMLIRIQDINSPVFIFMADFDTMEECQNYIKPKEKDLTCLMLVNPKMIPKEL